MKPSFVQNRCFARNGWDFHVRKFCRDHDIAYQGFSLLTANVQELRHPNFWAVVDRVEKTPAQVVFRFALQVGMIPLTGTSNPEHMQQDLEALDFELTEDEVLAIEVTRREKRTMLFPEKASRIPATSYPRNNANTA